MPNILSDLRNFLQRIKNEVPRKVAQVVQNHFLDNFKKESFDGQAWQKRKNQDEGRNLLVKSGALRKSIRVASATWQKIVIASDVPYAQIHNEGAVTHPTVTPKMRAFAWQKYKQTGQSKWKGLALTKKSKLTVPIPKRQFMGMDNALNTKINTEINNALNVIFK
jgi:phage gpG-like protein